MVTPELSFFAPLPACAAFRQGAAAFVALVPLLAAKDLQPGLLAQEEPSAEAHREPELFEAPKELSVSPPISLVAPMLSLCRPMPSHVRPIPFSVERVVAQWSNLVFGTSKPAQKESATIGRKFFSYPGELGLV